MRKGLISSTVSQYYSRTLVKVTFVTSKNSKLKPGLSIVSSIYLRNYQFLLISRKEQNTRIVPVSLQKFLESLMIHKCKILHSKN